MGFLLLSHTGGSIKFLEICNFLDSAIIDEKSEEAIAQITRSFFLLVIGRTIFSNIGDTAYLWCLPVIEDVDKIGEYNWGVLPCLFCSSLGVQYPIRKERVSAASILFGR